MTEESSRFGHIWEKITDRFLGYFLMIMTALVVFYLGSFASKARVNKIAEKANSNSAEIVNIRDGLKTVIKLQCLMAVAVDVKRQDLPKFCGQVLR